MVREVEPLAIVEQLREVLELGCQPRVCFEIKLGIEWQQADLLYFINWDAAPNCCSFKSTLVFNGDQEVVAVYVDNTEEATHELIHAFSHLSLRRLCIQSKTKNDMV